MSEYFLAEKVEDPVEVLAGDFLEDSTVCIIAHSFYLS